MRTIKSILGKDIDEFITNYIDKYVNTMDQVILHNAFTSNHDFTEKSFLDMPIHFQNTAPNFPCCTLDTSVIQRHSPSQEHSNAMNIVAKYIPVRWAGEPVDTRGSITRELLELNHKIKNIIASNKMLKEFYL